jgi:hypothetical protein
MIATGISEFTFGFAFLFEQAQRDWDNLASAPVLPNLYQEAALGWDAHLPASGTDFYYQFKLSDLLRNWNAKYILDNTYQGPYYRISLHRRQSNRQHVRLKSHAADHPHTYYVAPEFSGQDEFNASFLARQIMDRSRLIPLADCDPINDGKQHYITFQEGSSAFRQHSEATVHERSEIGRNIEELYRRSRSEWEAIDTKFAERLFERTTERIRGEIQEEKSEDRSALRLLESRPERHDLVSYIQRTSDILSVFYGLTLVLVGEPPGR